MSDHVKPPRTLARIEDELRVAQTAASKLGRELREARLAAAPVKVGDIVESGGIEYLVEHVDVSYSFKSPYLKGWPRRKNGEWSKIKRNIHGPWTIAGRTDVRSD